MKDIQKIVLKRLISDLSKDGGLLVLSLFMALLNVVLTLLIPIYIGRLVDEIIGVGRVDFGQIKAYTFEMVFIILGAFITSWLMNILNNRISFELGASLRKRAFANIQVMPISQIDSNPRGDLVSRVVADIDNLMDGVLLGFTQLFSGVMTIVGTLFFMFRISWKIAVIVAVATPLSLLLAKLISEKTYKYFSRQADARGRQTGLVEETIRNGSLVKLFDYSATSFEQFEKLNHELNNSALKATFYSSTVNPSTRLINNLIYASICLGGALLTIQGALTVGTLTSFLSYASSYAKPFNEITSVITEFQNALACGHRIYQLIDFVSETDDGIHELTEVKGAIEFCHVNFSYSKDKKLIEDFNLKVEPGQRVAIVGPTGAGKSTIINLLMRFYDIDSGDILIDGKSIKDIKLSSLRSSFGMVLQESWLKDDTIANNIRINNPEILNDELISVAKSSHIHSFVSKMKKGYDTVIAAKNSVLSAGQLQLLCIARVMMKLPPMLILDEATSNIDTRTEQKIQSTFNKMMKNRTTFVVAHRLSTIKEADVILFLKDGKIVEQGNHAFLLQKDGFYAKLYQSQFKEF